MRRPSFSKTSLGLTSYLLLLVGNFSVTSASAGWTITQLTDNDYPDRGPHVSGASVVWSGDWNLDPNDPSTDSEIFLYDGSMVSQLTDNDYSDFEPQVSGANVVWTGSGNLEPTDTTIDDEIFLYDGSTITQLTANNYHDGVPKISGSNLAWISSLTSTAGVFNEELFFYDGSTVSRLTENSVNDWFHEISGSNVVWGRETSPWQVVLYDGLTVTRLSDAGESAWYPDVSGSNVVWQQDNTIFLYDGNATRPLTDGTYNASKPRIDGSNVVWESNTGIYYYNGADQPELLYTWSFPLPLAQGLQISGSKVVWILPPTLTTSGERTVFAYDGSKVTELASSGDPGGTQISGSYVVWSQNGNLDPNDLSTDSEIFVAYFEESLAGDFNGDGRCDGADFLLWQRETNVGSLADWQANYGLPFTPETTTVPEPGRFTLAFAVVSFALSGRRR
ncbi:MAG: hypothetical protein KDA61_08485 [Planctomycetales bacterium]|nr:hypothetical protein [Planctomycetales bacterium]